MTALELPSAADAAATGALRVGPAVLAAGAATGPLAGSVTVTKDLFDVAGQRVGAGNPDWLADAAPAATNAVAVQRWVDAGATVVGISHTDELAFSLSGTNVHYGTPRNPRGSDRIPGGSSSGSVAAVAGGLVDYALATDTGGSTRVPASYSGVFGIRTTHGRVPMTGVVPLAPRFDTVGVLAGTGAMLERATGVLLAVPAVERDAEPVLSVPPIVLAGDVLSLADPDTADAVRAAVRLLGEDLGADVVTAELAGADLLGQWRAAFMARQMPEIWQSHGEWVTRRQPSFGPGVAMRMDEARNASREGMHLADEAREQVLARLDAVLPEGGVLAFAAASGPAPRVDLDAATKGSLRGRTIAMTCIAGLGGLPAVSLPLAEVDRLPVGVCLVARPGEDELLLAVARAVDAFVTRAERAA
ncbi:amidase family protein [Microbacterium ureisolvens]|uniref:Glutamyl-tRNA amidotransferase n=1 Tax=Microbacterium ureisolvens TaxID=2781186 RepID=A0ABS7HW55_9MICO|nr:amidase family protein [Microbacterium ureisolvens]MBW9108493.1 glutamyl-tRNA amidotransferase [Microbacterium ureisolvens]